MARSKKHPLIGAVVGGRYRLVRVLSDSASSGVFEAYQDDTQRSVALKLIYVNTAEDSELAQRFNVRLGLARRVHHPNAVRMLDSGWDQRGLFVAMKVLKGETLAERLHGKGPMHPRESAAITMGLASALGEAHTRGLVHCGIHPASVFLHRTDSGEVFVKLLNLGLEQFRFDTDVSGGEGLPARQLASDILSYQAPERRASGGCSPASDLYGLGILSFRMLSGDLPFGGAEERGPLPVLPPGTPYAYRELILDLLKHQPSERPADCQAIVDVVRSIRGGYRLGRALPDGAGAGRGVVPQSDDRRGHRGNTDDDEFSRLRRYSTEREGASESLAERTKRIEESLLAPLEKPKREPFGLASLLILMVGFLVWWMIYGDW